MITKDPLVRGNPGATSLAIVRPSVLMIKVGTLNEVRSRAIQEDVIARDHRAGQKIGIGRRKYARLNRLLALKVRGPA
jgi:hypothetical protein